MRKFNYFMVTLMMALFVNFEVLAQEAIKDTKFLDNWSVTVKGGVANRMRDMFDNSRGMVGVELSKQVTPITRLAAETELVFGSSSWNTYSPTMVDFQYAGVLMGTNWMNLVGGYKEKPRFFEVETVIGAGLGHAYKSLGIADRNTFMTKAGANFNFNLGKSRAWTVSFMPAIMYDMVEHAVVNYNANRAYVTLQAGVTYHFKNHDGKRSFSRCDKKYSQYEWESLNNDINNERAKFNAKEETYITLLKKSAEENAELKKMLENCKGTSDTVMVSTYAYPIQFLKGSSELTETSNAALNKLAQDLNESEADKVVVGYASVEGDTNYNQELSVERAKAVYDKLVSFGVNKNQITYIGRGATDIFSKENLELNRVVVIE